MVLKPLKIMNDGEIVKEGHLKRLKTLKKRYFVLRSSPRNGKSRLEYYESQKKFRHKNPPKRVIYLDTCFNIVKKEDTKKRSVFVLYTHEDAFGLIANSEDELNSWIKSLQIEQRKEEILAASVSTWPVTIKPRGLGTSKNLVGHYDLQLSNRTLSLVTKDTRDLVMEVSLVSIRRTGQADCFFFMELGRGAATGAGELWIQVEDQIIAQNMHETILSSMHNISISGDLPNVRRRCASETKRPKSRPRPISAVINPMGRGRCGTEPNLSLMPNHSYASRSTRDLTSTESPKSVKSALLNHLVPRRKSKDGSGTSSLDSSCGSQEDRSSVYSDKVLMSPPSAISSPSLLPTSSQPEYVNVGPNGKIASLADNTEDYMKMLLNRRRTSDSYMDMQPPKLQDMQGLGTKTTQTTPQEGDPDMTSLRQEAEKQHRNFESSGVRSECVKPKRSPSPRQRRTNESALPNKLDIREFVSLKKSPEVARRNPNQDYTDMKPKDIPSLYVNFVPTPNLNEFSPSTDSQDQPLYVNVIAGRKKILKEGDQLDPHSPQNGVDGMVESSSYEEMHRYVNISSVQFQDKKTSVEGFRKHSLESALSEQGPEYVNIDFSGITKSKSTLDMPEYINFIPGRIVERSGNNNSCETASRSEESTKQESNGYMCPPPRDRWQKSPRSRRRDSEPAKLEHFKCMANTTLAATQEDKETEELHYAILDLNRDRTSSSASPSRRRPSDIDLSSCYGANPGPRSAPVKCAYAEVDFRKSDGIRQARQETRELINTS